MARSGTDNCPRIVPESRARDTQSAVPVPQTVNGFLPGAEKEVPGRVYLMQCVVAVAVCRDKRARVKFIAIGAVLAFALVFAVPAG